MAFDHIELDKDTSSLLTQLSQMLYNSNANANPGGRIEALHGIERQGLRLVGASYQRMVFLLPDEHLPDSNIKKAVVKFPTEDRGIHQSQEEIEVWNSASVDVKSYLLPLVDYDIEGYWVVMPYADRIESSWDIKDGRLLGLENALGVDEQRELRQVENWGDWRGNDYLLDYGSYVLTYLD